MKELHRRRWLLYNRLSGQLHIVSILVSTATPRGISLLRATLLCFFIHLSQLVSCNGPTRVVSRQLCCDQSHRLQKRCQIFIWNILWWSQPGKQNCCFGFFGRLPVWHSFFSHLSDVTYVSLLRQTVLPITNYKVS